MFFQLYCNISSYETFLCSTCVPQTKYFQKKKKIAIKTKNHLNPPHILGRKMMPVNNKNFIRFIVIKI